jgi:hypothetical protein
MQINIFFAAAMVAVVALLIGFIVWFFATAED